MSDELSIQLEFETMDIKYTPNMQLHENIVILPHACYNHTAQRNSRQKIALFTYCQNDTMEGTFIDLIIDKLQWLLDHPEVTWSGSWIYALSLIGSLVLAVASCLVRKKKKSVPVPEDDSRQQPPAQEVTNQFNNNGADQNNAVGPNAIGKQVINNGVSLERYATISGDLFR
ncbi:MAG: hypothetical protein D3910_14240 [Candidatus Electrothrix sp. ATG2]|nr:hypothetical protein [Candidatus Electrothrix sp. ATG2]